MTNCLPVSGLCAPPPTRLLVDLVKAEAEMKRRAETRKLLHYRPNQAKRADSGSTARLLGGLPTWITNNVGVDVSAGNGDGSSAIRSSGSTALTYDYLASAHQMAFEDGGAPNMLEVPPSLKRKFSQLAFSATPSTADVRYEAKANSPAVAIGSVDKWLSDFGTVDVVVNRQLAIQANTFLKQAAFLLDTDHISVAMLRSFEVNKLARTGDAVSEFVVSEYTLSPDAPNAHAAAYGMT
jgi:hypothetical protein